MSICFIADVMCDGEDCAEFVSGDCRYYSIKKLKLSARKLAKKSGWKTTRGRDFCPRCAKKIYKKT